MGAIGIQRMTKDKSPSALGALFSKASVDRVQAAKLYFSGQLDALRSQALSSGDRPWRILRYQRIVDPEKVGYPLSRFSFVRPETFEKHIRYLTKHCRIVTVDKLAEDIWEKKEIPDKTVAITLDGGWIDNFVYAFPLLLRHQVPATMFLPTAFIGTPNFFWTDKVLFAMRAMEEAGLAFTPFEFFNNEQKEAMLVVSPNGEVNTSLIFIVVAALSAVKPADRALALDAFGLVARQLGARFPDEPAFMNWDDIALMKGSSVSFGSLGHTHGLFSELSEEKVRDEILTSRKILEDTKLPLSDGIAPPEAAVNADALRVCGELRIPFLLAHESAPPREIQTFRPLVLNRVNILEGETSSTETFACHLWYLPGLEKNG